MADEWREVLLEDLATDVTVGHVGPMASEHVDTGVPFLRSQNVDPLRINLTDLRFITGEFHNRLKKSALSPGDVVIVRTGKPGACAVIPASLPIANCSDLIIVRCGDQLEPRFLAYYVNSVAAHHVDAHLVGAVQQHFNVGSARKMTVRLPGVAEQRAIARVLGTLDDKIELNRRMSETLEAMARAVFKAWLGSEPRSRVLVGNLVTKGVIEIGDGYRAKNDELGSPGLPFIRAGDLQGSIQTQAAELLRQASVDKAGSKVSRVGDVAFTSKGTIGRFARVSRHTPRCVYSPQVCYWRSLDPASLHPAVLYAWMTSEDLASQIEAVSGQTDMALYVSLRDQRRMEMPHFPASQCPIGQQLGAFFSRQDQLDAESKTLASIRDALLPPIISGQLGP